MTDFAAHSERMAIGAGHARPLQASIDCSQFLNIQYLSTRLFSAPPLQTFHQIVVMPHSMPPHHRGGSSTTKTRVRPNLDRTAHWGPWRCGDNICLSDSAG